MSFLSELANGIQQSSRAVEHAPAQVLSGLQSLIAQRAVQAPQVVPVAPGFNVMANPQFGKPGNDQTSFLTAPLSGSGVAHPFNIVQNPSFNGLNGASVYTNSHTGMNSIENDDSGLRLNFKQPMYGQQINANNPVLALPQLLRPHALPKGNLN